MTFCSKKLLLEEVNRDKWGRFLNVPLGHFGTDLCILYENYVNF